MKNIFDNKNKNFIKIKTKYVSIEYLNYFGPDTECRAERKVPPLSVLKLEEFKSS